MRGIALVIDAVNIVLRHLGEQPDGAEARQLRDKALGYIEEVAMWSSVKPSVEKRDALMKKVLALHVEVTKVGAGHRG